MLNLNKYYKDAGYPDRGIYREYMAFVPKPDLVGAKIIWQVPTFWGNLLENRTSMRSSPLVPQPSRVF